MMAMEVSVFDPPSVLILLSAVAVALSEDGMPG
jgi:hypothetical protein